MEKQSKEKIYEAVQRLLAEAKKVAAGDGEYATFDEVFGDNEKDDERRCRYDDC
jgi:hypothetical protein